MATQRWALSVILALGLYGIYSVSFSQLDPVADEPTTLDLEAKLEAEAKLGEQRGGILADQMPGAETVLPTSPSKDLPQVGKEDEEQTVEDRKSEEDETESLGPEETTAASCSGPTLPPSLPVNEAMELKSKIWKATREWGYDQQAYSYRPFKGLNLLDIGMGQGPMGVVAMHVGVKSYKGMDPALCINRQAMTRDKRVGRAPNPIECEMVRDSAACQGKGEACEMFRHCTALMSKKYRGFPFTGLEMMQAFKGALGLNA